MHEDQGASGGGLLQERFHLRIVNKVLVHGREKTCGIQAVNHGRRICQRIDHGVSEEAPGAGSGSRADGGGVTGDARNHGCPRHALRIQFGGPAPRQFLGVGGW